MVLKYFIYKTFTVLLCDFCIAHLHTLKAFICGFEVNVHHGSTYIIFILGVCFQSCTSFLLLDGDVFHSVSAIFEQFLVASISSIRDDDFNNCRALVRDHLHVLNSGLFVQPTQLPCAEVHFEI